MVRLVIDRSLHSFIFLIKLLEVQAAIAVTLFDFHLLSLCFEHNNITSIIINVLGIVPVATIKAVLFADTEQSPLK